MPAKMLESVDNKLSVIIRLLASKSVEGKKKTDSILALGAMGLDRNTIAEIVDTSPKIVSTRLSEAKKKTKSKRKKT